MADAVYEKSQGNIDIHGYFLELVADDLHHSFDEHEVPKKKDNLPMSEGELVDALIRVNSSELIQIESHKDNTKDLMLSLKGNDDQIIIIELLSLSTGGIKFKTGWKEILHKKRNSSNSVGNSSSNSNPVLDSTHDESASKFIISQNTENETKKSSNEEIDFDAWLDDLSLEELESLLDDYDFLHQEDKDVETEKPKKQRAKRRVDEVNKRLKEIGLSFNGTKTATWTDERIDKYLDGGYYASSNPNYAQAYITYMTPKQFLDLTVGGKQSTLDMILRDSESYGEIDFKKLGDSTPLFLEISEGKNVSKVVGHEGRHRMYLLGKAGFEKVPVLLFDYKTKYDKSYKDTMKLSAQRYNNTDLISRTRDAVVSDVIPFSQGKFDDTPNLEGRQTIDMPRSIIFVFNLILRQGFN